MKRVTGILTVLLFVFITSSCVEDSYEEIELSEIKLEKSTTDEDDIPDNPPGSCSACIQ